MTTGYSLRGYGTQLRDRLNFQSIPLSARVALPETDFINFLIPAGFPTDLYDVAVSTLDTTAPFLSIGPLSKRVKLPNVVFDPVRTVVVAVPRAYGWPRYHAILYRGKTYELTVPKTSAPVLMKSFGRGW